MSVRISKAQPPWLKDGERDRWIPVSKFALLVMRSPKTIYDWLYKGDVLAEFGYKAFRDARGQWRIQVRRQDLIHLNDRVSGSSGFSAPDRAAN